MTDKSAHQTTNLSWKTMLVFLIPLMLSNFLQSISATISSILLGQFIGVQALAAVSVFFPVLFLMISFLIGIANASTVLIGQAYGARDDKQLKAVVGTSLFFSFLLGLALFGIGLGFGRSMFELIGTPADIFEMTLGYATIMFAGLPILFPYIMYTTFMRGTGDSKTPFYFLIISTGLTVTLTPWFVLGGSGIPSLGINGAALAFIIADAITLVLLLFYLERQKHPLRLDKETMRNMKLNPTILKLLFKIGIPTGIQMIMVSLSSIALVSLVNRYGSSAAAAFGAANQIISYVQMPAISIGMTVSIFGAHAIGAGLIHRLQAILLTGIKLNLAVSGILIVVVYVSAHMLLSLFITDAGTLSIAQHLLMLTLWSYLLFGLMHTITGIMRASGDVFWPTLLTVTNIWVIQVPVAYWLSQHSPLELEGIWLSFPIAFTVGLLLQTGYYVFFWKNKEKVRLIQSS